MEDQGQASFPQGREVPHSRETEMGVLAAMLLDKDVIPRVVEKVDAGCFYLDPHRAIFEAVVALADRGKPVDLLTLTEHLKSAGSLDRVGGGAFLSTLFNYLPTTAHLDAYLEIIQEKALLRSLGNIATDIVTSCHCRGVASEEVLDNAEKRIFELTQRRLRDTMVPMRVLVKRAMEQVESLQRSAGMLTGVGTGFKTIDSMTCGLQPSDLVVLAARPSMGKTALALNIAEHAAVRDKVPVGIFSLEMSRQQLVMRLLCAHARVNAQNLRQGFLSQQGLEKLVHACSALSDAPIYIDDNPGMNNLEIRAKARIMKAKFDVGLIVIDYLQLMQAAGTRPDSRQQEVSDISRSLKALARELDIPVLVLSQLNREAEGRRDHKPMLSDLRESGAIEQDADVVFLLMRPAVYPDLMDNRPEDKNLAYLNLAKQRNGPTGERKLVFLEDYTRFEEYAAVGE
ncbi:MAG TPA: replicative DNA helicase [bacterium]|nr:replicative DNA helicase [bacterium]HPQ66164.1 replicative DNA helicase [bacterium]